MPSADVSLSRNGKLITQLRSGGDIKESTVSFLKVLLPTVEKLEPLPSRVYLEFQVSYMRGTPAAYEPPKFRPAVKKPGMFEPVPVGTTMPPSLVVAERRRKWWWWWY